MMQPKWVTFYSVDPGVHLYYWARWMDSCLDRVGCSTETFAAGPVVIEVPRIYPRMSGDPEDIIQLAFSAGRIVGNSEYLAVRPRDWKGTVRKDVMLRRIESRMTDAEMALVDGLRLPKSKRHNVIDAVGIGLNHLGRL